MKKIALFTAIAGLTLVGAAPPSQWSRSGGQDQWSGDGYPPCSATVRDRCIQLYERGVATAANLALNERLGIDREGVGLAAVSPEPQPYADEDDYAFAEAGDPPMAPDWDEPAGDWQDDDDYAALDPQDDYYPYEDEVSGM